jgi:O-antigen/teichoic acid export membrane protein
MIEAAGSRDGALRLSLGARVIKGLASSALGQVISIAQTIVLVPLFLSAWGAAEYGRWIGLTSLVSYLSLLDFGGQNYVGNLLAGEHVKGNEEEFRRRLSEGVSLFLGIAIVALVVCSLVLLLPPSVFPVSLRGTDAKWILLLMSAAFLISIPAGVYATAYRASGLFVRGTMLGNVARTGALLISIALLLVKAPPVAFAAGFLASGVLGASLTILDSRRVIPSCRDIRLSLGAMLVGRIHLGGAMYFWLMALAQALNIQGVVLVLVTLGSPIMVATYVTHRTIAGLIAYPGALLQAPLWPELTFLSTGGRVADLRRIAVLAIRVVTFSAAAAAVVLYVLGPRVYALWTHKELRLDRELLLILVCQGVLAAFWSTSGWSLLAANRHRPLALWSLANGVITVAAAALFVLPWGMRGVALATLGGDVLCGAIVVPVLASNELRLPASKLYASALGAAVAVAPLGLIAIAASFWVQGAISAMLAAVALMCWTYFAVRHVFGQGESIRYFSDLLSGSHP